MIDKIVSWLEDLYYKKSLKEGFIYTNSIDDIAIMYSKSKNIINVYSNGVIYNVPIYISKENSTYSDKLHVSFNDNLSELSVDTLQIMLREYETLEEYDKCILIRNVIELKLQNNDN